MPPYLPQARRTTAPLAFLPAVSKAIPTSRARSRSSPPGYRDVSRSPHRRGYQGDISALGHGLLPRCFFHGFQGRVIWVKRLSFGNFHLEVDAEVQPFEVHSCCRSHEAAEEFAVIFNRHSPADRKPLYPSLGSGFDLPVRQAGGGRFCSCVFSCPRLWCHPYGSRRCGFSLPAGQARPPPLIAFGHRPQPQDPTSDSVGPETTSPGASLLSSFITIGFPVCVWPARTGRLCTTTLYPLINFFFSELPKAADLVSGHLLVGDPLVDRIPLDPEISRALVY